MLGLAVHLTWLTSSTANSPCRFRAAAPTVQFSVAAILSKDVLGAGQLPQRLCFRSTPHTGSDLQTVFHYFRSWLSTHWDLLSKRFQSQAAKPKTSNSSAVICAGSDCRDRLAIWSQEPHRFELSQAVRYFAKSAKQTKQLSMRPRCCFTKLCKDWVNSKPLPVVEGVCDLKISRRVEQPAMSYNNQLCPAMPQNINWILWKWTFLFNVK